MNINLLDLLNEGVYDPGIFKAVFTAGGPGSGKTYTSSELFGMPQKMPYVSADGLKSVNSDKYFELELKKHGLSADLAKLGPDEFAKAMELRGKAKATTKAALRNYINGRLGMLIDGTGKDYGKIAGMRKRLKDQGYDTYMIFVNTDLDVALARNKQRERVVPEKIVTDSWKQVQNNLGKFQGLFGSENMLVVDNSEYKEFPQVVKKMAKRFVSEPIKNPIAKKWIKAELKAKAK